MSRPLRFEFPGALWHVTARGNERKTIYRDDEDRREWLGLLGRVVGDWGWVLHAYVLMPNHYHLLVETPDPTLSEGMRQLNGVYTQDFNRKYKRAGHLCQGRFKGILVSETNHLVELLRYVVLNPVRARLCQHAGQWAWSNYRATAGKSLRPKWLEIDRTLKLFSASSRTAARRKYIEFVHAARDVEYRPWEQLRGQIYLGDEDFAKEMAERIGARVEAKEIPRPQREPVRPDIARIARVVCAVAEVAPEALRQPERGDARVAVAILGRIHHHPQREIGVQLGISRAGAAALHAIGIRRLTTDKMLRALVTRCQQELSK